MNTFVRTVTNNILAHKLPFLAVFFVVFTITYAVLFALDWLPEPKTETSETTFVERVEAAEQFGGRVAEIAEQEAVISTEEPISLAIPVLRREVSVVLANSNSMEDLDRALLSGVVRHPDSARLGEEGNVVILGHSSYLPNVLNRNFQALNGTQNLEWGDIINVFSDTTEYIYQVKRVYKVKASEAVIPTEGVGKRLTLVTCNSFATADDRFIIEADLVSEKALI